MHTFNARAHNMIASLMLAMGLMTSALSCDCEGEFILAASHSLTFSVSQDIVFCRTNRGLQKRIEKEGELKGLKCNVIYWGGAWEIEEQFGKLEIADGSV